jgi:hypothetical protein
MKVIIAGSRSITSYPVITLAVYQSGFDITEVVSGTARGVDTLGEQWATLSGISVKRFPADWGRLGKRAGHERNHQMLQYADALIAVWDGKSPGTRSMIGIARTALMPVYVHSGPTIVL